MDAIYQKHHESIEANNRIVNLPKQIETISGAQTDHWGRLRLSTLAQSIAASIEVQGRTCYSQNTWYAEKQVQDSQARSEQQYNYVTSQANALAEQIRNWDKRTSNKNHGKTMRMSLGLW